MIAARIASQACARRPILACSLPIGSFRGDSAFATWLYRASVFLGIAVLVYHFTIKAVGIAMGLVEFGYFLVRPVWMEIHALWKLRDRLHINRRSLATLAVLFVAMSRSAYRSGSFALRQQSAEARLAHFVPTGALLYLESKDFSALLADWDHSPEKQFWLKSDNYEIFSRSRLFLRLNDANTEFSRAAGVPAGPDLLRQLAGKPQSQNFADLAHRHSLGRHLVPLLFGKGARLPSVESCRRRGLLYPHFALITISRIDDHLRPESVITFHRIG